LKAIQKLREAAVGVLAAKTLSHDVRKIAGAIQEKDDRPPSSS
jgi:hypothetical protein